jgi:hypothetical protein
MNQKMVAVVTALRVGLFRVNKKSSIKSKQSVRSVLDTADWFVLLGKFSGGESSSKAVAETIAKVNLSIKQLKKLTRVTTKPD